MIRRVVRLALTAVMMLSLPLYAAIIWTKGDEPTYWGAWREAWRFMMGPELWR